MKNHEEFLIRNKFKIIVIAMIMLLSVFLIIKINQYNIIPEHIHSIDYKTPGQRTDLENITVLERSLQKDPNNVNDMIKLTDLYIKIGNKRLAEKTLIKILEIDPSNKEADERLKKLK
ncbi:MAG TPA: tetratricopeptide repeat protein [Ignavibacteria bacterium]|nr:tetratricopeptide repeat protein [Ignavibacteria bacterium]HRB01224.1 tetratricopeptide repeat protein [Ignavibacteria bacterium]